MFDTILANNCKLEYRPIGGEYRTLVLFARIILKENMEEQLIQ